METLNKPVEELTLGEVIGLKEYKTELYLILNEIERTKRVMQLRSTRGLKRDVTDRLEDKGLLTTSAIIDLYPKVLAKVEKDLSANERQAIIQIGDMALHATLQTLKKKQQENDRKVEEQAN